MNFPPSLQAKLASGQIEMAHGNTDIDALQIGYTDYFGAQTGCAITPGSLQVKMPGITRFDYPPGLFVGGGGADADHFERYRKQPGFTFR